ncbi:MAG: 16S rRNA (cytosine(967)-C(5))-methyltransferase RsmB [Clostridium sp.]|jgi:16S rRNA (cytosine967-C5)-methyltransferase|nr:16S rRNA (cytosine(967)-C(5))-methyltransferase RsmB [Clostridium sp.]
MDFARQTAFETLLRIERDGAYGNLALGAALDSSGLNERDTAFCASLVYGVTERQISLDWLLSRLLSKPIARLRPPVITALRMGAYQLHYMDSVPASAAVDTSVRLLKANGCAYAAGLANAVLRKCAATGPKYPEQGDDESLSIRYSVPQWLVELWRGAYGEEAMHKLLAAGLEHGGQYLRVNTTKTDTEGLIAALAEEGIEAKPSPALPNAVILPKGTAPQKTKAFAAGLYHAQGLASQYCCAALNAKGAERVLDICAAPGGKSFTLAQDARQLTAVELYPQRAELVRKGAKRLGLGNIEVITADAAALNPSDTGIFDAVLCDVPCSGLGTLSKKPDIRKKDRSSLDNLPAIQYTIFCNAAFFVRDGGRLIYSTCTLNPAENELLCKRFLAEHGEFEADGNFLKGLPRRTEDGAFLTLLPHIHGCDGFFIAVFKKGRGNG